MYKVLGRGRKETVEAYIMLAPTIFGLVFFSLGAASGAILLSFTDFRIKWPPKFVGFENYIALFSQKLFLKIIGNTFYYVLITVVPCLILSFLMALLINNRMKFVNILRAAYFWPVVGSMTAIALVWKFLLNPQYGLMNFLLGRFGIKGPQWFGSPKWALVGIAIIFVWKNAGYYMTIILSGLQNIPAELYESALIDGADWFRKLLNITIPLLSPTLFFVTIMASIASFQVFDSILVINPNGGPANATLTLSFYIYQNAFKLMYMGYASAASVLLFIIVLALSLIQFKLQDKWVFYE